MAVKNVLNHFDLRFNVNLNLGFLRITLTYYTVLYAALGRASTLILGNLSTFYLSDTQQFVFFKG